MQKLLKNLEELPDSLRSKNFFLKWTEYQSYRCAIGKFTKRSENLLLIKVSAWGQSKAIQAIDRAIESGTWTSLFEPKDDQTAAPAKPSMILQRIQTCDKCGARPGALKFIDGRPLCFDCSDKRENRGKRRQRPRLSDDLFCLA